MINQDSFSKRVMAVSIGLTLILLSGSLFVFSLSTLPEARAHLVEPASIPWDDGLRGAVGLGIKDNTGYFITWGNPNTFYKVDLSEARDWYMD